MNQDLKNALLHPVWVNHKIKDVYKMDGSNEVWKIAYYPIFEDGKTNEVYNEPRALVECPIKDNLGKRIGTDFREIPLRYLSKL